MNLGLGREDCQQAVIDEFLCMVSSCALGTDYFIGCLTKSQHGSRSTRLPFKVAKCNHQVDSLSYLWPEVCSGDLKQRKEYGHRWHRMPLLRPDVIKEHKQHKPNPSLSLLSMVHSIYLTVDFNKWN